MDRARLLSFICLCGLLCYSIASEEITYGIAFDAGSGSVKAYLYQWNRSDNSDLYRKSSFQAVKDKANKPVSIENTDTSLWTLPARDVPNFLSTLLNYTLSFVPPESVYSTILVFQSTADPSLVARLTPTINAWINSTGLRYTRRRADDENTRQGVDGWIALNYFARTLESTTNTTILGALDLGASSAQITYNVHGTIRSGHLQLDINNDTIWDLYTHTYEHYGINHMPITLYESIREKAAQNNKTRGKNPCWPKGYKERIIFSDNYELEIYGTSDATSCEDYIIANLKLSDCGDAHCGPGMVYQPVTDAHFVAFGAYYYTFEFYNYTGNTNPDLEEFRDKAMTYCGLSYDAAQSQNINTSNEYIHKYCFNGVYMYNLLTKAYGLTSKQVNVTKTYDNAIVGWAPGSMIHEVTSDENSFNYCSDYNDCSKCLYNNNCGFCEATGTCQPGGKTSLLKCESGWQKREFDGYCRSANTSISFIIAIVVGAAVFEVVLLLGFFFIYKAHQRHREKRARAISALPIVSMDD